MSNNKPVDVAMIREKYINLAKSKGSYEAITALHMEMGKLENRVFENGFDRERLNTLQELREISRELWTNQYITETK